MKYKYKYKDLLESRSPKQLKKALEVQGRVMREKMQEAKMMALMEKKMVQKINFMIKTSLI